MNYEQAQQFTAIENVSRALAKGDPDTYLRWMEVWRMYFGTIPEEWRRLNITAGEAAKAIRSLGDAFAGFDEDAAFEKAFQEIVTAENDSGVSP